MTDELAAFAGNLEPVFDAWSRGEEPASPAAPRIEAPVERARLARSLSKLAQWPARTWSLERRLGDPPSPSRDEAASLLAAACRSLAAGVEALDKDAEEAARRAAEARSAAAGLEKLRLEAVRGALPSAPLPAMKAESFLNAYSTAADAVERAAVDLAAAAAAEGLR